MNIKHSLKEKNQTIVNLKPFWRKIKEQFDLLLYAEKILKLAKRCLKNLIDTSF